MTDFAANLLRDPTDHPKIRILIVDDSNVTRRIIARIMERERYEALEAATGGEALQRMEESPDLVILDVNLPDMSGFEVCRAIRANPAYASVPVLHLSATYTSDDSKIQGLMGGADGYMTHPIVPHVLTATVNSLLRMRRAEQEARTAVRHWQATFDAISDGVCLLDRDGKVVRANRALGGFLNRQDAGIAGIPCEALAPGATGWAVSSLLSRVRENRRRESADLRLSDRWFQVTLDPMLDDMGGFAGAICIMSDITVRKQAEEETERNFQEIQAALKMISRNAFEPISMEDQLERTLDLIFSVPWIRPHSRGCLFLVQNGESAMTMKARRGMPPLPPPLEAIPVGECLCGRTVAPREAHVHEHPGESAGGRRHDLFPYDHHYVPITSGDAVLGAIVISIEQHGRRDEDKERAFLSVVANTLAGLIVRRKAEEELQRLAKAVEQASEMILVTDTSGTIQYANPAFLRTTGYSRDEVVGKNPRLLKSGRHDEAFYRTLWTAIAKGEVWTGRFVNRKKDGTLFEEDAAISAVRDGSGRIINYVAVKHDVTRQVALEAQLSHSQKMEAVGRLAGGVAHDINNYLGAITAYGELAKMTFQGSEEISRTMDSVIETALKASTLIKQLLAFSRKQPARPEVLSLNGVIEGMEKMVRRLIGEDIEIRTTLRGDAGNVKADRSQVEQVLVNLLVNARDAMPKGGTIAIETASVDLDDAYVASHPVVRKGRYVMLAVSDTGAGIPDEIRDKVFEPFFTTKDSGQGSGLGLSTVYGIVKQHGGYIWVYSEAGKGSTFKIYLPRCEEERKAPPEPAADLGPLKASRSGRILFVEDNEDVRKSIRGVLEAMGYKVAAASCGEEAVKILDREGADVDLLITDVVMPGMSGKEMAEQARARNGRIRVLFISGYTDNMVLHHGILYEGFNFLQKPFSAADLAKKIEDVLG